MLENFGQQIRILREKKGITLNAFAKELEVSTGYLSQLETGKTETIQLKVLEKLQKELMILPVNPDGFGEDDLSFRFSGCCQKYYKLKKKNHIAAEYLLSSFESGIAHFLNNK